MVLPRVHLLPAVQGLLPRPLGRRARQQAAPVVHRCRRLKLLRICAPHQARVRNSVAGPREQLAGLQLSTGKLRKLRGLVRLQEQC